MAAYAAPCADCVKNETRAFKHKKPKARGGENNFREENEGGWRGEEGKAETNVDTDGRNETEAQIALDLATPGIWILRDQK
ncbi:MAG: hypothetical protein IJ523_09995 [Succinivibrionaceae bacterium]|nr:hypothetical protein [Succinivibrionaceae bacterium]